jgi:hypothetical protein
MTLTINDTTTTNDKIPHTAQLAPGRPHYREVPWLPGKTSDRNTVMILTGIAAQTGVHQGQRLWPAIQSWEVGVALTASGAIMRASEPPGKTSSQEPSQGAPGPEGYRLLSDGRSAMEDGGARLVYGCEPHAGDECSSFVPEPEAGQS